MKKYLFLCLLSLSSQASEPLFMRVLENLNRDGILPAQQLSCSPESKAQALAQECATKLCGDVRTATTVFITENTIPEVTDPKAMARYAEVEAAIEKLIKRDKERMDKLKLALEEKLKQGEMEVMLEQLTDSQAEDLASRLYESYLVPQVDYSKPIDQRLTYMSLKPVGSKEEKAALEAYSQVKATNDTLDFSRACYAEVYTEEEALKIFTERLTEFKERLKRAREKDPSVLSDSQSQLDELLTSLDKGKKLKRNKMGELASNMSVFDYTIGNTLREPTKWAAAYEPPCKSEVCRKGLVKSFNSLNWRRRLENISAQLEDPKLEDRARAFCRSSAASQALKESEAEEFRAAIPRIREDFTKKVLNRFSEHSRGEFNKILDTEFNFAFGNDNSSLDSQIEYLNSQANYEPQAEDFSSAVVLGQILIKADSYVDGEVNMFPNLDCAMGLGATAWDAFSPEGDEAVEDSVVELANVFVSFFSCSHPAMGEQIFAHELGHAMSYAFHEKRLSESSYKEFLKDRNCMSQLNGLSDLENPLPFMEHPGDRFRTEEDTADLMAFRFGQGNSTLMSCALLEPDYELTQYVHPTLLNRISLDTHSSPLTRAVREAIHKNIPLPTACSELIQSQTDLRFNSCL